ncbi:MAG: (deoxy)nucleoside triphosphate pyrophosphohydrolase [Lachnospiraceae bacterium]|nr:(deoxy)nucleoside triphosphate pyrophosphohydrolase [Lachnospiraceae bacterium]
MAHLCLTPDGGGESIRQIEVPEALLEKQGIEVGKQVCFTPEGEIRKYVRVVAAVIRERKGRENRIFATARGYGAYKGWWEFPGGKIEPGETPQEALIREIREELTARIRVGDLIRTLEYDYPEFHLSMDCFWAEVESGELILKEAAQAKWLTGEELPSVQWLPADLELVEELQRILRDEK